MKKIHTKIEYQYNKDTDSYDLINDEYYYFNGQVAEAKGEAPEQPSTTTTVQKSDPWEEQKPYLTMGFKEAEKELWKTPQYYPGQTVVPYSPETETALNMQTGRALNGSPIQFAANDELTKTLSGNYLYGGQGFNEAVDAATNKILPTVNSAFEKAGRTGSGLAATAQTQAIADAFANQYGQERQNMQRGMLFAPQVASMDYQDISKLAEVGAQRETLDQQKIADEMTRYNYGQNIRKSQLMDYLGMIQGNYGGTSSSSSNALTPQYRNSGSGMLGSAFMGASMFPANPVIGGLGGLLMGGLF
jgi:hypothetical protein